MTTPISPEDLDEVRSHNPDYMNGDTIDQLVARVEELTDQLGDTLSVLQFDVERFPYLNARWGTEIKRIRRVLEGTE